MERQQGGPSSQTADAALATENRSTDKTHEQAAVQPLSRQPETRQPQGGAYHLLMQGCAAIAALLLGTLALLVFGDVVLRNTAWGSIPWSVEITEYMLTVATFTAAPWLLYTHDHIRVDIVLRALPPKAAQWLERLTDSLGVVICLVLTRQVWIVLQDTMEQGGLVFKVLVFPEWWLFLPMLFAFSLLSVEFVRRLWRTSRRLLSEQTSQGGH